MTASALEQLDDAWREYCHAVAAGDANVDRKREALHALRARLRDPTEHELGALDLAHRVQAEHVAEIHRLEAELGRVREEPVRADEPRRWTLQAYSNRVEVEYGPELGGRWLCEVEHDGEHFASCRFQGETVTVVEEQA